MTDSLTIDPRIIPLVRSLKEQPIKSSKILNKIVEDLSSDKTSENSPNLENEEVTTNNKDEDINNNQNKNQPKKTMSLNKKRISKSNSKHMTTIKKNTKISIDAEAEPKTKVGSSQNSIRIVKPNTNNKIKIVSKNIEQTTNNRYNNNLNLNTGQHTQTQKKINNIKTKSKYIQNLLNDMSIKKYKQSCIDILKNDNVVKNLYEQCGFEKTNYTYENFLQKNFFNRHLFMYKLEMLFSDESNFTKKNFKENFFKNEIIKYLNKYKDEIVYKEQMINLKNVFKEGYESIKNFELFHN